MHYVEMTLGVLLMIAGVLSLLVVAGPVSLTLAELTGAFLLISAFLFALPALLWGRRLPALTILFIPGFLAFALGLGLMYTGRAGLVGLYYFLAALPVALGLALLVAYSGGAHLRFLWTAGLASGGVGVLLLALLLWLIGSGPAAHTVGALAVVLMGLLLAYLSLARPSRSLVKIPASMQKDRLDR